MLDVHTWHLQHMHNQVHTEIKNLMRKNFQNKSKMKHLKYFYVIKNSTLYSKHFHLISWKSQNYERYQFERLILK